MIWNITLERNLMVADQQKRFVYTRKNVTDIDVLKVEILAQCVTHDETCHLNIRNHVIVKI